MSEEDEISEDELFSLKKIRNKLKSLFKGQGHGFILAIKKLLSPTTITLVGGIIALSTLIILTIQTNVMIEQTEEFKRQNGAIVHQNELLQKQNELNIDQFEKKRLTELVVILYDTTDTHSMRKQKSEAIVEYVSLKRKLSKKKFIDLAGARLRGVKVFYVKLDSIDFSNADLSGSTFQAVSFINCNFRFANCNGSRYELCDFTNSLMSNASFVFDKTSVILKERFDLGKSDAPSVVSTDLVINFQPANGLGGNSILDYCNFTNCELSGTRFDFATVSYCNFKNIHFGGIDCFTFDNAMFSHNENLTSSQIRKAIGCPQYFTSQNVALIDSLYQNNGFNYRKLERLANFSIKYSEATLSEEKYKNTFKYVPKPIK